MIVHVQFGFNQISSLNFFLNSFSMYMPLPSYIIIKYM
jgi:hypothetical protein